MTLKELRKKKKLSQKATSELIGIPYRTYCRYEEEPKYIGSYKYKKIYQDLFDATKVDEEHGILKLEDIKETVAPILNEFGIKYCYLFGSYARGEAKEKSDVDLLIDTDINGIDFFMLIEKIRVTLGKKIDLLRLSDIQEKNPIALEILKEGIRII